jgi:hypothetical protein
MSLKSIIAEYNFQIFEALWVCFRRFIAPAERLFYDGGLTFLNLEYATFDGVINLEERSMVMTSKIHDNLTMKCLT